jgi:serine/threonine protein kinase/WD40 repeat protein
MTDKPRTANLQDIEFLTKVAAFWKAKNARWEGTQQFGRFVIQRCLGQGAFGVVYLAFDSLLGRDIAIKVPGIQTLSDESHIKRFLSEGQHLGSLVHPNVAQVYEANEIDGLCFLAMKYYPNGTLADWLRAQSEPIPIRLVVQLFNQIVAGVAAAHSAGIIHRDLKPSNILMELVDDDMNDPQAQLVVCVADFGLAKNCMDSELSIRTADNARIGTAGYVAPEQWRDAAMVSATADVYSLGAILLELLHHGTLSWQDCTTATTSIAHENNRWASKAESILCLKPKIPAALFRICYRCLSENPKERFADAVELQAELTQSSHSLVLKKPWMVSSPIAAWVNKNLSRKIKMAGLTSILLLAILIAAAWMFLGMSEHGSHSEMLQLREHSIVSRERWVRDYALGIRSIFDTIPSDSISMRRNSLDRVVATLEEKNQSTFEINYLRSLPEGRRDIPIGFGSAHLVLGILPCPTMPIIALHGPKNDTLLFDLDQNRLTHRLEGLTTQQRRFAFSPDGKHLVASSLGGPNASQKMLDVLLWEVSTGKQVASLGSIVNALYIYSIGFLSIDQIFIAGHFVDGHRTKVVSLSELKVVGNEAMQEVIDLDGYGSTILLDETPEYRLSKSIELKSGNSALVFTDKASQVVSTHPFQMPSDIYHVWRKDLIAYVESAEGFHSMKAPSTLSIDQRLVVWSPIQNQVVFEESLTEATPVTSIAISNDGKSVFTTDANGVFRVIPVTESNSIRSCGMQSSREVWGVDYHSVSNLVLCASDYGFVAVYSPKLDSSNSWPLHGDQLVTAIRWRPKSDREFASAGFDKTARLWRLQNDVPEMIAQFSHPSRVRCLTFSTKGDLLVTGCDDGIIRLWNLKSNQLVSSLGGHKEKIRCVGFSKDGSYLISGGNDGQMIRWNLDYPDEPSREAVPSNPICCAVSPQGDRFVFGTQSGVLCIRSSTDLGFRQDLLVSKEQIRSVSISNDGMTVATGSQDGAICLWNLETGIKLVELSREGSPIMSLSFSSDNSELTAGLYSGEVVTWRCDGEGLSANGISNPLGQFGSILNARSQ